MSTARKTKSPVVRRQSHKLLSKDVAQPPSAVGVHAESQPTAAVPHRLRATSKQRSERRPRNEANLTTLPQKAPRLDLGIYTTSTAYASLLPTLRRYVRKAHSLLKSPLCELSIVLIGDKQMAELHHEFLGILGPTDVLTFELDYDAERRVTSGDIAVCVPVARRQARQRGGKTEHEVLLYALHGLLHLNGFDDRTDSGFQAMHRREDHILAALGIGPVFNPAPRPSRPGAI